MLSRAANSHWSDASSQSSWPKLSLFLVVGEPRNIIISSIEVRWAFHLFFLVSWIRPLSTSPAFLVLTDLTRAVPSEPISIVFLLDLCGLHHFPHFLSFFIQPLFPRPVHRSSTTLPTQFSVSLYNSRFYMIPTLCSHSDFLFLTPHITFHVGETRFACIGLRYQLTDHHFSVDSLPFFLSSRLAVKPSLPLWTRPSN